MRSLLNIEAKNFRSLQRVNVTLGDLNVLVGPNEAGKSNFLDLIEFLGDSARDDLAPALEKRGGYDRVRFRGNAAQGPISIHVKAAVTTHSSENAPDEYELTLWEQRIRNRPERILRRNEEFLFKRTRGRGRRIAVNGQKAEFIETDEQGRLPAKRGARRALYAEQSLRGDSLALSTLRRLPPKQGGEEVERFAELFTTFRVFNVDVARARRPSRYSPMLAQNAPLTHNASNLANAIIALAGGDSDRFADYLEDARAMIPGLEAIDVEDVGTSAPIVAIRLIERGLANPTFLEDASFGTVRVLALLALLYDPDPPDLTCIEEIDHGLHPYLFDRLVDRLREASQRTQLLVATHSPALVNRLRPHELIVVERAIDGSTRMPAITADQIAEKHTAAGGQLALGELWFSGSLGGVPR
jgi:predicted ATPase